MATDLENAIKKNEKLEGELIELTESYNNKLNSLTKTLQDEEIRLHGISDDSLKSILSEIRHPTEVRHPLRTKD